MKKIEVLGISVEKCYVEDVMEYVNENWYKESLSHLWSAQYETADGSPGG